MKKALSVERLREALSYDADTGLFTWRILRRGHFQGSIAGSLDKDGYRMITIDGSPYRAARLAWLYVYGCWPVGLVDHKNRVCDDDRIANLRESTNAQNQHNTGPQVTNTSGFKGVAWNKGCDKYQATIRVDGRRIFLGYFDTPEAAHDVYRIAAFRYHGEFARSN
jgi:hypothetical protein